ncbi:MAG: hypothetical protein Q8O46_05570 [bacterium]|nr:hypothetical protein [bacterium]
MVEYIEWLRALILNYPLLQYIIIFLGAAFGGEIALFVFSFLAAQNVISMTFLVLLSFLGVLASDSMWLFLGKTRFMQKIILHRYANPTISLIALAIEKVSRGNHMLALVFVKFLIGTRIVMLLYISNLPLSFLKFLRYNALATLLWLLVVIPIGFISGLGFTYIAKVSENLYAGVGFVLLILIIIVALQIWLKKTFIHMRDR